MLRWVTGILALGIVSVCCAQGQMKLPAKWEELTAEEFRQAIGKAQGTCLLPFGILEKHGPHLPLGTDLLTVRYVTEHAAQQEYAVIFPEYYFMEEMRICCRILRSRSSIHRTIMWCTCNGDMNRRRKWARRKTGRTGTLGRRRHRTCW